MKVDSKSSDIAESIPNSPPNRKVDRLQLDGKSKPIRRVNFRDIGILRPQCASDAALADDELDRS